MTLAPESAIWSDVGRKKRYFEDMQARFPEGTFGAISAVLEEGEERTEFVRDAVDRELNRREATNELARQLSARHSSENGAANATPATPDAAETVHELPSAPETPEQPSEQPDWLLPPEAPARGEARRDKALLDLLPVGVLIYRFDRLLYANRAFLLQMGYESLHALEEAGGLGTLYVEPGISSASSTSDTGKSVRISGTEASPKHAPPAATDARLFTISWDGDSALALIFSGARTERP